MYTYDEAFAATLEYFCGDDLAASVFVGKYALQDLNGNYLEKDPSDMHKRLASEFARIESKYDDAMSEEEIFTKAIDHHKNKKIDLAEKLYKNVIKKDPKHIRALNNLGIIFFSLKKFN